MKHFPYIYLRVYYSYSWRMDKKYTVLVVDDNSEVQLPIKIALKQQFDKVHFCQHPNQAIDLLQLGEEVDVVLLDMNYTLGKNDGDEGLCAIRAIYEICPHLSVVAFTAYGEIDLAVKAMKLGAADFVLKPWDNLKLEATLLSAARLTCVKKQVYRATELSQFHENALDTQFSEIIGNSKPVEAMLSLIQKVAETDANVLITGENGVGKELVARMVHRASRRSSGAFIALDMGAISETLFESELFGHEKGAFTDAKESRIGRMELAEGGTLFLDEIANLSVPMQSKLLRVLQSREVYRLGAIQPRKLDIRLVCATNANLRQLIGQGKFREDLFFRLNTIEVVVPPLRARVGDIPILAKHYLAIFEKKYGKTSLSFSKEAQLKLSNYSWPGNVRELSHVVERAVIMADSSVVTAELLAIVDNSIQEPTTMSDVEKEALEAALMRNAGNIAAAARELELGRTTLYRKMKRYGL